MQTPRVLWIDLRSARETPSAHARLRALCTTLMLTLADPAASADTLALDRLVDFYEPGVMLFEFDRDDAAGRALVDRSRQRFPRLTVVMLTQQPAPGFALAADPTQAPAAPAGRTGAAVRYVEAHLGERITLAQAAATCHLCKSEFSRVFKREQGTTFVDFVLQTRVQRAAALLAEGSVAVKEVAYTVGFNDLSYFGRVFRRHFGVAPSQYREDAASTSGARAHGANPPADLFAGTSAAATA